MRKDAPPAGLTLREIAPADEAFLRELYRSTRDPELALTNWTHEQKRASLRPAVRFPGSLVSLAICGRAASS
jgi:hypothetical protein